MEPGLTRTRRRRSSRATPDVCYDSAAIDERRLSGACDHRAALDAGCRRLLPTWWGCRRADGRGVGSEALDVGPVHLPPPLLRDPWRGLAAQVMAECVKA